jgi:hypothetical protein
MDMRVGIQIPSAPEQHSWIAVAAITHDGLQKGDLERLADIEDPKRGFLDRVLAAPNRATGANDCVGR